MRLYTKLLGRPRTPALTKTGEKTYAHEPRLIRPMGEVAWRRSREIPMPESQPTDRTATRSEHLELAHTCLRFRYAITSTEMYSQLARTIHGFSWRDGQMCARSGRTQGGATEAYSQYVDERRVSTARDGAQLAVVVENPMNNTG